MSNEYIGVVTLAGQAAIAGSIGGTPLSLTTVRVGDGNGLPITPNETMTDLVRRVGAAYGIAASGRDPVNPTMWRITAVIPAADGPFDIREIGVFDAAGTLIALAKHPFVEKRSPAQGNAVELTTDIVFQISDTAQITINLLPDVAVHIGQMLRAPFLVVDSATTTAPPASPVLGATYVIPAAGATGAWAGAGLANRLAQWTGEVWAAVDVPAGHFVVARDKGTSDPLRYLSRTAAGWGPDLPVAIRAGAWNYAAAAGTSNALSITLNPAPAAWADLLNVPIDVRITNTNTAADPTLAVVGIAGTKIIQRRDGTQILPLDLLANTVHRLRYDGTAVRLESPSAGENIRAVTSLVLWVRPDGADTNDGTTNTTSGALQTIDEALTRAARISGQVTIRLGVASTYAPWTNPIIDGPITILGDVAHQDDYILAGLGPVGGGANVFSCAGGFINLQGLRLHNTGPSNNTLSCNASGYISADHVTFTAASASIYAAVSSTEASMIYLGAGCKFGGTMAQALLASLAGQIVQTNDLTMLAGATFGTVAKAFGSGGISANPGATFAGSNTGKRYEADLSGVIYTYGAGANLYPGTIAGTADSATGGIYA